MEGFQSKKLGDLPEGWRPEATASIPLAVQHREGSSIILQIFGNGEVQIASKSYASTSQDWLFGCGSYFTS